MKLLLDQNLSFKLVASLAEQFPHSTHVRELGLSSASDQAVWEYAKTNGYSILSTDSDFMNRALLYGAPPKIIWLRAGNASTSEILNYLRLHAEQIRAFATAQNEFALVIP